MAGWVAGWVGGWLVGESDFNENPVVSLDLDLDFGRRLKGLSIICLKDIIFTDIYLLIKRGKLLYVRD